MVRENGRPNENNKDISIREYDGVNIYIEKHNINLTSSRKKLGIEVTTAYAHYAGRPRFENHISKTTRQYYLPPDKTNIKPTNFGEQVQEFMCKVTRSTITKDREDRNDADSDDNVVGTDADPDADSDDNIIGAAAVSDADSDDNVVGTDADPDADSVDVRARVDFDHKARKAISDTYYEWCFKNQERANKCLLCLGYTFQGGPRALEYCHIIPDKLGGNPVIENGILLCKRCNRGAGGTDMREYLQETWHDSDRTATFKRILHL
jgi:hypothetical protein